MQTGPRTGAAVDRRCEHRLRDARELTRTTGGSPARDASCSRARASASPTRSSTPVRCSQGWSTISAARSSATSRRSWPSCAPPTSPADELLGAFQDRRMELLASRGFDVSGLEPDQMTSAEDVYLFPNMVGPVYPGARSCSGYDPTATIPTGRSWTRGLAWPNPEREWTMPTRHSYADWHERDWGRDHHAGLRERGTGAARDEVERVRGTPAEPAPGSEPVAHARSAGSLPVPLIRARRTLARHGADRHP